MTIRDDDYIRLNYISDFIEDFVTPSSRARLHYLLSKPKRRDEIIGYFHSDEHLDQRYLHPVAPHAQNADKIYEIMRKRGAPSQCFVLSMEDSHKDQVDLKSALDEYVGRCSGTILYCREAKIGYWEGDDSWKGRDCSRCILRKK